MISLWYPEKGYKDKTNSLNKTTKTKTMTAQGWGRGIDIENTAVCFDCEIVHDITH